MRHGLHVHRHSRVLRRSVDQVGEVVVQAPLEPEHLDSQKQRRVELVLNLDALAVHHVAQREPVVETAARAPDAEAYEAPRAPCARSRRVSIRQRDLLKEKSSRTFVESKQVFTIENDWLN